MSNHDCKTMAVILVRILPTKPLIFIKVWAGGRAGSRAGRHMQGQVAQIVNNNLNLVLFSFNAE